ncbi:MAG: hypothetical protein LBN21_12970 [Treponema sp.]|jgi:hypothetical protein|nr:hypothetical protein [Treponema sp.]
MKRGGCVVLFFLFFPGLLFCQDVTGVIVDRNNRVFTYEYHGRDETIIAPIFLENEIAINLKFHIASYFLQIVYTGDHFTDIDSFNFVVRSDRDMRSYSEVINSIEASAKNKDFIDKSKDTSRRSDFTYTKEYKSGKYISTFEISMPNYKSDVFKYAKECSLELSLGGIDRIFRAGPEELRALQDMGLVLVSAGLK